jgi:hypothetical protein
MFFKRVDWIIGAAQNWWGFVVWLFPSGGAIMSAWSAHLLQEPWHLILFYSTGVFCFSVLGLTRLSVWSRENTIVGSLKADNFAALFGKTNQQSSDFSANCTIELQNKSLFVLYYQLEEADLSLSGRTNPCPPVMQSETMLIQVGSSTRIQFKTIPGLKPEPMTGMLKLKLKYGKKKESLNNRFELVAEPQIAIVANEKGPVGVLSTFAIKEMKYL